MEWVYCPICQNKTRTKIRKNTELIYFPFLSHLKKIARN